MDQQNKKTMRFEVRLTDEQKQELLQQAADKNMKASQYICYLLDREVQMKNLELTSSGSMRSSISQASARGVANKNSSTPPKSSNSNQALASSSALASNPSLASSQEREPTTLYRDSDLSKILWHLAHWGNNLNQAANALNRIAMKRIFSDAKNVEILQKAAKNIQEVSLAAKAFEDVAYELKSERHIIVSE